jgi:hypothetical protein
MARPVSRSAATTTREVEVVFSRLRRRYRGLALPDDLSGSQAGVHCRTDLPKTNAEGCGMRWHF